MLLDERATRELARAIQSAGREEVVGFLAAASEREPASFARVRNHGEQPGVFTLDPLEVKRVERSAAAAGRRIVAFVHSHRSGLELSDADRRSQARTKLPWVVAEVVEECLRWRVHPARTRGAAR